MIEGQYCVFIVVFVFLHRVYCFWRFEILVEVSEDQFISLRR